MLGNQSSNKIVVFESREIRRTLHNDEWWFVVNDIVYALTDSVNISDYIKKMRGREQRVWANCPHFLLIRLGLNRNLAKV
jgi:hypothetical protein